MLDLAVLQDLVLDLVGHVDGDRERQALEAAGAAVDLRIDAHDFAAVVEQRATRVARVDGHVRLDEGHGGVVGQRTSLGADDARGGGVLQAIRRADGQHPFTHLQLIDVAHLDHRQVLGVDLQHGHVGLRVGAQHFRLVFAAVGQLDGDFLGILHDVRVGEDDAVIADDEARAFATHRHFTRRHAAARARNLAEELGEGVIIIGRHLAGAADADVDDGWSKIAGDLREVGRAGSVDGLRGSDRGRRVGRHRHAAHHGGCASAANGASSQQRQHQARGFQLRGLHVGSCVHV
ncbi:hypothetical protein D3C73_977830 [compost metagenome]